MTAPPVPPHDEQLGQLAASGDVIAADDECLTSAEGTPTQVAPPIPDDDKPPTVAAYVFPEAYSQEPPERVGRSWRVAWRDAVLITVAGLAVAIAAGLGIWVLLDQHQQQPVPQPPTPPPTSQTTTAESPTPPPRTPEVPPSPLPSLPTARTIVPPPPPMTTTVPVPSSLPPPPDSEAGKASLLVELARAAGVTVTNVDAAVWSAKRMCAELRQGMTKQEEARATQANTGMSPAQAVAVVDAATEVYCQDQYGPWTYYPN